MKRCELDYHVWYECPENEIHCIICNNDGIKRKDMNQHVKDECLENNI